MVVEVTGEEVAVLVVPGEDVVLVAGSVVGG